MDPRTNRIILIGILIGIFAGGFLGWALGERMVAVKWMGDFFLGALKMLIVPLIVSSMIVGISGLGDIRRVGVVGRRTLLYYMVTTGLSVLIGLLLVNLIRPGVGADLGLTQAPERLQDQTGGFRAFVCWSYQSGGGSARGDDHAHTTPADYLMMLAVSRSSGKTRESSRKPVQNAATQRAQAGLNRPSGKVRNDHTIVPIPRVRRPINKNAAAGTSSSGEVSGLA